VRGVEWLTIIAYRVSWLPVPGERRKEGKEMSLMSKDQYIESLKGMKKRIFLFGDEIDDYVIIRSSAPL
jgi:hypothetical protein